MFSYQKKDEKDSDDMIAIRSTEFFISSLVVTTWINISFNFDFHILCLYDQSLFCMFLCIDIWVDGGRTHEQFKATCNGVLVSSALSGTRLLELLRRTPS